MSLHEYRASQSYALSLVPFRALLMAAMSQADDGDLRKLQAAFPDLHQEWWARRAHPGGLLRGDPDYERLSRVEARARRKR